MRPESKAGVLEHVVQNMAHNNGLLLTALISHAVLAASEFATWIRGLTRLRMIDVVVADGLGLAALGPLTDRQAVEDVAAQVGLDPNLLDRIARAPFLKEALRRLNKLREAVDEISANLPAPLVTAFAEADAEAFQAAIPGHFDPLARQMLLTNLAYLELAKMLLNCPEPFADGLTAAEPARTDVSGSPRTAPLVNLNAQPRSVGSPTSSTSSLHESGNVTPAAGPILSLWFSTPAFFDASSNAVMISRTVEELAKLPTNELRANLMLAVPSYCAIHTAWFLVLALRYLQPAIEGAEDGDPMLDLISETVSNVRSCLTLLEATGRSEAKAAKEILERVLNGGGIVSRQEVAVVLMGTEVK